MTDTNTTESESETDNSQLIERVKKLEAQVSKQQSTIERLMPSRRDILKAGAGGVVGAVALSGSSSASTGSAGTIGSASDRPDIFADTINADSVNTENSEHGPAKANGDIPLTISQDGSNPTFGTILGENEGWPDYKAVRKTTTFDSVDDHTLSIGHNLDVQGAPGRSDASKPQMVDSWESSFDDGTYRFMERHIQGTFKDGTDYRLLGIKVRYADTDGNEDKRISVSWPGIDTFSIAGRTTDSQHVGYNESIGGKPTFFVDNGAVIKQAESDDKFIRAERTDGNRVDMLYLGANNKMVFGQNSEGVRFQSQADFGDLSAASPQIAFSSGATKNADHTTAADEIVLVDIGGTTYEIPARTH